MITVLHFRSGASFDRVYGRDFEAAARQFNDNPSDWVRVASVAGVGDDNDLAYEKTNHIDRDWKLNYHVDPADPNGRYRSTSIGDVLVHSDGRRFFVASFGFEEF